MKKLKLWIRQNLKLVLGIGGAVMLTGCSTLPSATPTTTAATTTTVTAPTTSTSATSVTLPTLTTTQKAEFLGWAEACQGYALAVYGASAALANGTLKPAAIPYLETAKATVTPLCHSFPANPSQVQMDILSTTMTLTENLAKLHTTPAPTSPTASTTSTK